MPGDMLPWRRIEELPDGVTRMLAFVPDNCGASSRGRWDERCCMVERLPRGWWFDHHQGGYYVDPTHFLLVAPPDGFPAAPA